MEIVLHRHALERAQERGATEVEIITTVREGEKFPAKFNRNGFRKNFLFNAQRNNKHYLTKQIEAYCVNENDQWLILTVIVKYF